MNRLRQTGLVRMLDRVLNPRSGASSLQHTTLDLPTEPSQLPRRRVRARDLILNGPLVLGSAIVLALFLLVLLGPAWAPENPYVSAQHIVPHYDARLGEAITPPLSPSPEFPFGTDRWGNDLLSLLMHGARNTLVACAFVTMARVLLGLILGGIAGWNEGQLTDQAVMALVGVTTSVPMLVSSIILIYSLDIRKGLPTFIVALSLIGWTEIAQYIRSEFLIVRKMPYIEGAQSIGLGNWAVAARHVLPNILPQLLVIAFLEMGAVMMLLGELGFVGVYIGGGSRMAPDPDFGVTRAATLIDVPEWGAMLADGYRWLRSKPFVIIPPAVAFAVSVFGFNALGEGLRRLVEKHALNTSFLLRKRMLLVIAAVTAATILIINRTGPAPWFAKVASAFDGRSAYVHVQALSEMRGRGVGQEGGTQAATYIAQQFRDYGLEPGWTHSSYEYPLQVRLVRPTEQPYLALLDGQGTPVQTFRHQLDFGFVTEGHGGSGRVQGPVVFVGFRHKPSGYTWESFKGLDLRERIVLLQEGNAPADFATEAMIRGARGVLWIAGSDGPREIRSQLRLADDEYLQAPSLPVFRIRPAVAEALLMDGSQSVVELLTDSGSEANEAGWFTRELGAAVSMSLTLSEPREIEIPCVLGYKPGTDYDLARELVILFASYDGLGSDPDGTLFPGANHSASGVGVLLEIARLWSAQGLDARRSVLFVAWGGGQLVPSGVEEWLSDSANFRHLPSAVQNKPAMLFQLDGLGGGTGELELHPGSSQTLSRLLKESAVEVGASVETSTLTAAEFGEVVTRRIPWVWMRWVGADVPPDQDTMDRIEADRLQTVGEVLALALTKIVRESTY